MTRHTLLAITSLAILASAALADLSPRPVRLLTDDNVSITGVFYPAATKEDFAPAVLLLHSLGRGREEWPGLGAMLQRNGIGCLAIDLRGHGTSTRQLTARGPELLDYRNFTDRNFVDTLLDVNSAVDWLVAQTDVDKHHIAIIGAGYSAGLALQYATYNADLQALLLFSPSDYKGISPTKAVEKVGPLAMRLYVSRDDTESYATAKRILALHKLAGYTDHPKSLIVCSGSHRGGDMLRGVSQLSNVMLIWLRQVLLGEAPPTPPKVPAKKKK